MAKRIIFGFICFVLAGVAGFFGLEFYKKTGLFKKPGQLVFSESFLDSEAEMIRESLKDIELDSDLTFSYSLFDSARSSDSEGKMFFLADVLFLLTIFIAQMMIFLLQSSNKCMVVEVRTLYLFPN